MNELLLCKTLDDLCERSVLAGYALDGMTFCFPCIARNREKERGREEPRKPFSVALY